MKVRELIQELQEFDPDMNVVVETYHYSDRPEGLFEAQEICVIAKTERRKPKRTSVVLSLY